MSGLDYGIVAVFFVGIFAAGAYFYKWIGDADDFYVAGRKLTPFILAATITATNVNLYSFVGQAGKAYKSGASILWHTWTGNMALVFAGLFVIPIFRRLRIRTIPEYLEQRYGAPARVLVGLLWFVRLSLWLGIVIYTAVIAAQTLTGIDKVTLFGRTFNSWTLWVLAFGVIAVAYTVLGGMWSVALTDVLQFVLMMGGALIVLPLVMSKVGWWPGLVEKLPAGNLKLVTQTGSFNWVFTLAILLLGFQWACTDQGLLQRAFGAKDTKSVARGLVLAGIITTPFALLWVLPGIASAILHPGLANPDTAIPTTLANLLPAGIMGLVVCGFLASQMSTIDSNLSAAATLFVNDVLSRLKPHVTPRTTLALVRIVTGVAGIFMIIFSYYVARLEGAVGAYLTIISIMDMPLFIVAVFYGLLWRRANLAGALCGYFAGAAAGAIANFSGRLGLTETDLGFNKATFISAGAALVVCFVVSLLTRKPDPDKVATVWSAKHISKEETDANDIYHIWPVSAGGRFSLLVLLAGLIVFLAGTVSGHWDWAHASLTAVVGMVIFFAGGLMRLAFD
ncbi:MAG: sodium:solute symporter family protein [Planctomycetota bacterium]|jgi:SSS family solute:Na+ symporter